MSRPRLIGLLLALITLLVYLPVARDGFVNYDDNDYVTENRVVQNGLTWSGIKWAFTHVVCANWHPLTIMSHMLDCRLYGLNASGHHLTNVLLHTASVILLFLVLRQMTGFLWRSVFVAALFAIHPLRVESVAWVAERKDVLSGLFFMLTLGGICALCAPSVFPRPLPDGGVPVRVGLAVQAHGGHAAVCVAAPGLLAAQPFYCADTGPCGCREW
jgi:hypothetical protein